MALISRFKSSVVIETFTEAPDATGQLRKTYATAARRRACVTPTSGSESFQNNQQRSDVSHTVEFRADEFTKAITTRDRIKLGDRVLNVTYAPVVIAGQRFVTIFCTEDDT